MSHKIVQKELEPKDRLLETSKHVDHNSNNESEDNENRERASTVKRYKCQDARLSNLSSPVVQNKKIS